MENLIDQNTAVNDGVDVEMAVLALCMRNVDAVIKVHNTLTPEDFTDERNSIIFGVVIEMFFENCQIDRITVYSELERRGIAGKVGGQRYIYRVGDTMAVMSALDSYIVSVKERSDRIKIIRVAERIKKDAQGSEYRAYEILDDAINRLVRLRREGETMGLVPMSDVLKSTVTEIYTEQREGDSAKIRLGFPKLDAMLGGLGPGTIHILAARPGMGKTALAINMATNVAANQKIVVVFSLEMTNNEIGKRLLSSAMTKPVRDIISSPQMSDSDRQQMDRALTKLRDYPIYFYDKADINPGTMKALIEQLISTGKKPALIFVDYLQLINMKGVPGRSRNDEVANISRNLKLLAKELEIPIIALSQLSRDSAKRTDHTPQISDLRDSGAIEQDADTIMFVDRPGYYNDKQGNTPDGQDHTQIPVSPDGKPMAEPAYIYLAKNRHGPMGKDAVWWIPGKTLFYEYSGRDPQDPEDRYPGTVSGDAAAQKYEFEDGADEEPEMDPPLSDDEIEQQADEEFMADTHDQFPEGFV